MRPVPAFARVGKAEYREIRNDVLRTAKASGFHEVDVWNLVIETLEKRRANVAKNKAKHDLTLRQAADMVRKQATEERMKIVTEQTKAK